MAALSNYEVVAFDQSDVLGSTYRNKRDVQGGVCAALCVAWVHAIEGGASTGDINALIRQFDLSVNKQRIITDAYSQVDGVRSAIYNSISHITRLTLTFEDSGDYVDPIKQCFVNLNDGFYFLSISFDEGAHMIALWKDGDEMVLFDPNFGVFQADDNTEVEDLAEALFAEYASIGMAIESWRVFSLAFAESALARFKRISGAA